MKKREKFNNKKKGFTEGLDFDLIWGYKGIKISLIFLIILILLLATYLTFTTKNLKMLNEILLKNPSSQDYCGVFAGVILFIAVPFLIGIRIGMKLKKK